MSLNIWVPWSARPKHKCDICGAKFYDKGKYLRHVPSCVKAHRSLVEEIVGRERLRREEHPLLTGEAFDPEALEWVLRHQRR